MDFSYLLLPFDAQWTRRGMMSCDKLRSHDEGHDGASIGEGQQRIGECVGRRSGTGGGGEGQEENKRENGRNGNDALGS